MGPWVSVGFLAFFAASLLVGVRLLLVWRRTRKLPELCIGVGVLGIGPVGVGAQLAAGGLRDDAPGAAAMLFAASAFAMSLGALAKLVFNWKVYRPQSTLARASVWLLAGVMGLVLAYQVFFQGFWTLAPDDPLALIPTACRVAALFWGAAEAFSFWGQMRKRARLGLSDPVVTNRFVLWGVGAFAAGFGSAVGTVAGLIVGRPPLEIPSVVAFCSAIGFVAAVALFLAFSPPAGYVRWLRGRSSAA